MGTTDVPEKLSLDRAAIMLLESGDRLEGGWGNGPKFPMPSHLGFLIRAWESNKDPRMLAFAELTAEQMMRGGIMDQLGGGIDRYAVDGKWLVPHFEKMLYDQAQVQDVYQDLYQITEGEQYAMPTASSVAALEFLKLAEITGREDFQNIALSTLKAHGEVIKQTPTSMTCMLEVLDFYYDKRQRLVLAQGDNGLDAFFAEVGAVYLPHLTVMGNAGKVAEFERGLKAQGGKITGDLCEGESCLQPQIDAKLLMKN